VIEFPDVHVMDNLVRAVRDVCPDRPGIEYSEIHLGITPMTTAPSTRQQIAKELEEQDEYEHHPTSISLL
jgi:hypothetical protein